MEQAVIKCHKKKNDLYAKEDRYSCDKYGQHTFGSESKKDLLMAMKTLNMDVISVHFGNEEEDVEVDFEDQCAYKEITNLK